MTDVVHHMVRSFIAPAFRHGAAVALIAGASFFGAGQVPASAQSTSWEEGCAMRIVNPGSGDALRVYNCARQKDCQQMADAQGHMMMDKGCFFVMPRAVPSAQADQVRPVRKR